MSATYQLFTRWKAKNGLPSDNAGAISLGVTRSTVSLWKGGRNADADVIERMAKDLGENPALWAAQVMAEQTQGEAARAWGRIARQLGAAAAVALFAVAPQITHAFSMGYEAAARSMPIMSTVRSWIRRFQQSPAALAFAF